MPPGSVEGEEERLAQLRRYAILDTPPEEFFDRLTRLAARICNVPVALITFVDRDRQWIKSTVGATITETPREHAFCAHTIVGSVPLVVEDARLDPRFAQNPFVVDEPKIRFYAGIPLMSPSGYALGTLCVLDREPRTLAKSDELSLTLLAQQAVQQLELRRIAEQLRAQSALLAKTQTTAHVGGWSFDLKSEALTWTDETYRIFGLDREHYTPTVATALHLYAPEYVPLVTSAVDTAIRSAVRFDLELQILRNDGERRWVRAVGRREDLDGQPRRIFGVIQDITDRRHIEGELQLIAQRERDLIGYDLHDGLGQELTGISFLLGGLSARAQGMSSPLAEDIAQAGRLVQQAISTCRSLAYGLTVATQSHGGIVAALRRLATVFTDVHTIDIAVRGRGATALVSDAVAGHCYRIVQEAISNAIMHGGATHVRVALAVTPSRLWLSVTDDGIGMAMPAAIDGMGLKVMRHRAKMIGAELQIGPARGGGTRVVCRLTLRPPLPH